MNDFFSRREQTMMDIKKTLGEGGFAGSKADILDELKREMITLLEEDIKLWRQLSNLNKSINDVEREFLLTRCRSSTYDFDADEEENTLDDEIPQSKPRAFSLNSSFVDTTGLTAGDLLFRKPFIDINNSNVIINRTMKDNKFPSILNERKCSLMNLFNPLNMKSGPHGAKLGSITNNLFHSSLHVGLTGVVDDLIKPLTSKHILPRRKLHGQSNTLISDEVEIEAVENDHYIMDVDSRSTGEISSNRQVSYERDKKNKDLSSNEASQFSNEVGDKDPNADRDNELICKHKNTICSVSSQYLTTLTEGDDQSEDEEVEEINSSYLVFEDGYVSCRIMTPGLEKEIKLKHETEEEPLEYLKCKSGFARFRSGSDSESSYSMDSCQTYEEILRLESIEENVDDVCCDIKYLFDSDSDMFVLSLEDVPELIDSSKNTDADAPEFKHENESDKIRSYKTVEDNDGIENVHNVNLQSTAGDTTKILSKNTDEVSTDSSTAQNSDMTYSNGTEELSKVEEVEYNTGEADAERLQLSIDDTVTVTSREILMDGLSVFVYKEKLCNFTYRISSMDSGIGDEIIN